MKHRYDVIVVGGGHAGVEAASAAARLGAETLLLTGSTATIGALSCNPAIGGVGKGHLVREIDALGGIMGRIADRATIQFRVLNRGKGPAVWSPRAQVDRNGYPGAAREKLAGRRRLTIREGAATGVREHNGGIAVVIAEGEERLEAAALVLCCGTFLGGVIHIGRTIVEGGRRDEPNVTGMTESLEACGITSRRFKTGTPPRIEGASIDFSAMTRQDGDEPRGRFSSFEEPEDIEQLPCWITATSEELHRLIEERIDEAPLFSGQIASRGPRYCPSIEDKVVRFPDRTSHLVFVEPEGRTSSEFYLNGLSTSLPINLQRDMVHSVRGLEAAEITQYGYAIEYDYFPPAGLLHTLESPRLPGLFLAGQINGTTGYEEAAAQGLVAGINAAHRALGREPFLLERTEAVIGVLIDDLVTKGVTEPYRMFTSRIDHRLTLRADNADLRLSSEGRRLGLLTEEEYERVERKRELIDEVQGSLSGTTVGPDEVNAYLEVVGTPGIAEPTTLGRLLKRPRIRLHDLLELVPDVPHGVTDEVLQHVELTVKYEGYVARERRGIEQLRRQERIRIPGDFPYEKVQNIATEAREKLMAIRPRSLGQAARISGVSTSDLAALVLALGRSNVSRETSGSE